MKSATAGLAAVCLLLTSCDPLDRSELSLTFDERGEQVAVSVASDENHLKRDHSHERERLGDDLLAGRDEWSLRFAAAGVESERISIQRSKRLITSVVHEGRIATDALQKFFFDVGVVVEFKRLEDSVEVNLYPGASTRATRQQRTMVDTQLQEFARIAVRYFEAVRDLYAYLDANGERAQPVFHAVFSETEDGPPLTERETRLADAVRAAATAIDEAGAGTSRDLARLADLAYNPFPAALTLQVPGEILSVEGFTRDKNGLLSATTSTPAEALASLEGRWIEPDPYAYAMNLEGKWDAAAAAAGIASKPRRAAAVVTTKEVLDALTGAISPAPRYHVRWSARPARPAQRPAG